MEFKKLFEPIKIGPVEIKNRIAQSPCNLHFSVGGFATEQDRAYFAARAKGGVGLSIVGAVCGLKKDFDDMSLVMPNLFEYGHLGPLQDVVEGIHEYGAKAFVQIIIGLGGQTRRPKGETVSASAVQISIPPENKLEIVKKMQDRFLPLTDNLAYPVPRPMTVEEIQQRQDDYCKSVRLAMFAGFDGVEIHACHGYLLHHFLSPRTNKRNDDYGGSLTNRMRFTLEVVKKVKATVQDDIAVGMRISADEHMPGGFTLDDVKIVTKACQEAGLDYINLSDGSHESRKYFWPEKESDHLLDEAKELKKVLKIPVITPSIHDPVHAETALGQGKTDMISLGRQLMADPDWANKVKEGKISDIQRCRRDYICYLWMIAEGQVRCEVNPNLGRERYMPEYFPKKKSAKFPPSLLKKGKSLPKELDT